MHRHVARDADHFGFEIDAPGLAGKRRVFAGAQEIVTAALVHQGLGVVVGRHRRVAGQAHQLDVVEVSRAVDPLVRARQWRQAHFGVKREGVARFAAGGAGVTRAVQGFVQVLQLRREEVPVVQHLLQAVGDAGRIMGCREVARDDDELAVARAVFVSCQFH